MADTADTPARPTVASATATAEQALESATLAHGVSEAQAAEIAKHAQLLSTVQREQQALAVLINGLKNKPGELVKEVPQSKLDGILARLEKVEQKTKGADYDWTPVLEKAGLRIADLETRLGEVEQRPAPEADAMSAGEADELTNAIGDIVAKVATLTTGLGEVKISGDSLRRELQERMQVWNGDRQRDVEAINSLSEAVTALANRVMSTPTTSAESRPTVGAKVLELMNEVAFIGKSREAKIEGGRGGDFSYMFRGIDDAQDAVGAAMRKVGLIMRTTVLETRYELTPVEKKFANGGGMTQLWSTCVVTMEYTFVDPSDMSEFAFQMVGEGKDVSDKSASKAASMACKYALFQALMIPVKGIVESDGEDPQITSETDERTPGAKVNDGDMTPAQAVNAYQQQAADKPAEPQQMSPAARKTRATAAVQAMRVLTTLEDPADALRRLEGITERVRLENLGDVVVDQLPVKEVANATWKVLKGMQAMAAAQATSQGATRQDVDPGPPATRAQDPTPPPSDDPWGSYTPPVTSGDPW